MIRLEVQDYFTPILPMNSHFVPKLCAWAPVLQAPLAPGPPGHLLVRKGETNSPNLAYNHDNVVRSSRTDATSISRIVKLSSRIDLKVLIMDCMIAYNLSRHGLCNSFDFNRGVNIIEFVPGGV